MLELRSADLLLAKINRYLNKQYDLNREHWINTISELRGTDGLENLIDIELINIFKETIEIDNKPIEFILQGYVVNNTFVALIYNELTYRQLQVSEEGKLLDTTDKDIKLLLPNSSKDIKFGKYYLYLLMDSANYFYSLEAVKAI